MRIERQFRFYVCEKISQGDVQSSDLDILAQAIFSQTSSCLRGRRASRVFFSASVFCILPKPNCDGPQGIDSFGCAFGVDPGSSGASSKICAVAFRGQFVRRSAATWPLEAGSAAPRHQNVDQEWKSFRRQVPRMNPDSNREAGRIKIGKLEKALEAMWIQKAQLSII